ncbi:MAG: polyprenyl diphosphate synthase [Nitrospirota bacterium]
MPQHVGIIMDGNGRWARARGLPRMEGHRRGAERARDAISAASELGIKCLTLYAFSHENWQRPRSEITVLMKLLEIYLRKEIEEFQRLNIRYRAIGEIWRLPESIQELIRETEEATAENTGMTAVSALSYGGRNEILRAVRKAVSLGAKAEDITEDSFESLLDTAGLPPVDLIIRTSGEIRISNFLLWQAAYAELYFTNVLWPDFTREEFLRAMDSYRARERRFGTVPAKES